MKSNRHPIRAAGLGLLVAGLLTACGGGDTGASDEATPQDGTSQSDTGSSSGEEITTAETDLGTILVDEEGMTLYMFTKDTPGKSVCEGDCLAAWPPVSGDAVAGEGVDASMLGSTERSDGSAQATYADRPLYYYAEDQAAGDVNGQAVGGVWYVLGPDGTVIKGAEPSPDSGGNGGY